jgi:2-keto-4-pentenoate hydratase
MMVAEVEFAFRLREALAPRAQPYTEAEVMAAVGSSPHLSAAGCPTPAIRTSVKVGAAQLIADNACACWLVIGDAAGVDWALDPSCRPIRVRAH